jgi:hypothetical protein
MIARLPEMHRQLRELSTQIALLTSILPHDTDADHPGPGDLEAHPSIPPIPEE